MLHDSPESHEPQLPPHPSSPHWTPAGQLGVQHPTAVHDSPGAQHAPSQATASHWHWPKGEQVALSPHTPQEPPQPSSPQVLPAQFGLQQASAWQTSPTAQHDPPQGKVSQVQVEPVGSHVSLSGQAPHEPPQPSSPQTLPVQSGVQQPASVHT